MFDLAGGFLLAALPALPILLWLRRNDKARPEPVGLIGRALLLGFIVVAPAALAEFFLYFVDEGFAGLGRRFFEAFILAALVEEGLKFGFLRRWLWKRPEFDEATDGIVYAVAVSLGFAIVENFVYTWHRPELLVIRSLTAVPLHAIATGHLGFWLGLQKMRDRGHRLSNQPRGGWLRGLGAAVFIHGGYDFLILGGGWSTFLALPFLLIAFLSLRRHFALARRIDEEAGLSVDSLMRERF